MRKVSRTTAIAASGAALAVAVAAGVTAFVVTDHGHVTHTAHAASHAVSKPVLPQVLSVTPPGGSRGVNGTDPITVKFAGPVPAGTPLPTLSPAIAGTWQRSGDQLTFTPTAGFTADTHVTVTVPAGGSGNRSGYSESFTTTRYSTLRLQQILAQLGYLPMTWTAILGGTVTPGSAAAQLAAAYSPPAGSFTWKSGFPSTLHDFWKQGAPNTLDQGAITAFEADHGMKTDGVAGSRVWAALLTAAEKDQRDTHGYSYAVASYGGGSLTIWHDGREVLDSPANLGIGSDPTPIGTFPVYEKLPFQVMQGTNPGGSHYADPVNWVSYFSGGSAVHYIPRGSYGFPQSLGCVELPWTAAEESYHDLPYGSLVTVTP